MNEKDCALHLTTSGEIAHALGTPELPPRSYVIHGVGLPLGTATFPVEALSRPFPTKLGTPGALPPGSFPSILALLGLATCACCSRGSASRASCSSASLETRQTSGLAQDEKRPQGAALRRYFPPQVFHPRSYRSGSLSLRAFGPGVCVPRESQGFYLSAASNRC